MSKTALRRTEITIETREVKTIRIRSIGGSIFCPECQKTTEPYSPDHVATYLRIGVPEVLQSVDAGDIHLIQHRNGGGSLCGNSLANLTATTSIRNANANDAVCEEERREIIS